MPDVKSERWYALVSATASAGDNRPYATMQTVAQSAFLFELEDVLRRMFNCITSPSATLVSGTTAPAVAIAVNGLPSGINGMFHNVPFSLSATGAVSALPASAISTTSATIRKVLVTIGMSALPVASSFALGGWALQFVYGSAYAVSAGAVTTGGQSAYFNLVPLPKASSGEIAVGWLNITNSFTPSATGIANHMMICDLREVQGVDLSAIMATVRQP